jgi:hypothetical protein
MQNSQPDSGQNQKCQIFQQLDQEAMSFVALYRQAIYLDAIFRSQRRFAVIAQTDNVYRVALVHQSQRFALNPRLAYRIIGMDNHAMPFSRMALYIFIHYKLLASGRTHFAPMRYQQMPLYWPFS